MKRLTRTGNSLALVLDRPILEATRIDATTPLEVSTDGDVIIDGNKRTALAASLVFLLMNEVEIHSSKDDLTDLVVGVAEGTITKSEVAVFLQKAAIPRK